MLVTSMHRTKPVLGPVAGIARRSGGDIGCVVERVECRAGGRKQAGFNLTDAGSAPSEKKLR